MKKEAKKKPATKKVAKKKVVAKTSAKKEENPITKAVSPSDYVVMPRSVYNAVAQVLKGMPWEQADPVVRMLNQNAKSLDQVVK